jgi:hypothetical protein
MTHDKYCPENKYQKNECVDFGDVFCLCDIIADVRADERARWNAPYFSEDYHRGYQQGSADAQKNIAERIYQYGEDTHPKHDPRIACQRCDITAACRYAAEIATKECE